MAIAIDKPAPEWRNFAAWSAVGTVFYILITWGGCLLLRQNAIDAILRPTKVSAILGLGLVCAMAVTGFSNRKRPANVRNLRNFTIQYVVAIILFLLPMYAIRRYGAGVLSALGTSEWVAAATGVVLVIVAVLGAFVTASVHIGGSLVEDEVAAEDLRERGRLVLYSFAWTAACGLLLIGLSLAGPGGLLSPATALAAALVLIAVLVALELATRRLSDELARTLSHETRTIAFYLLLVLGGSWAMLARLGFVIAPAPLDWLTMFTLMMFAGAFIATGRRNLLTR